MKGRYFMGRKSKKSNYAQLVKNRKIPILTLDSRWHEIFTEKDKTAEIKALEVKVNQLLKQQGKLVHDIKDMKKLKNKLINEIVENMEIRSDHLGKAKERKLERNKQFITELNDKIKNASEELADLPYQIKEANEELLIESLHIFYDRMNKNKVQMEEISDWIMKMRNELKEKIVFKQDMETMNSKIYTYMHDLLGPQIMEKIDSEQEDY